jgi:adenylate cyclase
MDEFAYGYSPRPDSLERSLAASRRALELDGSNQMARWFRARALFYQHDVEQAVAEAQRAIDLNLNNATVLAAASMFISYTGQWDRGKPLFDRALALDPYPPGWYFFPRFIYYYKIGDYQQALAQAQKINLPTFYWNHVALACAYAQLGRKAEAEAAARAVLATYPDFPNKVRAELRKYNHNPEVIEQVVDGLRKAGMTVPDAAQPSSQRD